MLSGVCETIGARARSRGVMAGHVALKLRYTDFVTLTRRRMITPTSVDYELHRIVLELYREVRTRDLGSACSGS